MKARLSSLAQLLRRLIEPLTGAGRLIAGLGVTGWVAGWRLGWDEAMVLAACSLAALAVGAAFTVGRDRLEVEIDLQPPRLVVGETAAGRIAVRNIGNVRMLPLRVEAPVGLGLVQVPVPSLAAGAEHEELFLVPTERRSVIPVGPASSVRGDPLGLIRREVTWTELMSLYVHPRTVALAGLTAGWLRDLEGRTTNELSPSDVELHTLREYVPGDDRRHVHWRTSARIGTLMVRQFVDTRRSHLAVVLSTATVDYADDEEFELAVSIAGSLGRRALFDDHDLTSIVGLQRTPCQSLSQFLDGLAAIDQSRDQAAFQPTVSYAVREASTASVVALIVGSTTSMAELRVAADRFGAEVRVLAFRAAPAIESALRPAGLTTVVDVADLAGLERVIRVVGVR